MEKKDFSGQKFVSSEAHEIIRIYGYIAQLKALHRQGWISKWHMDPAKVESVGDHIFAGCLLTFLLAREYAPEVNAEHALKIFLFHDLGESIVGDYTPYDDITEDDKNQQEAQAFGKIFADLKNKEEYIGYWEEYRAQVTKEAKFAKIIDKLEAVMMAYLYEADGQEIGLAEWDAHFLQYAPSGEVEKIFFALREI